MCVFGFEQRKILTHNETKIQIAVQGKLDWQKVECSSMREWVWNWQTLYLVTKDAQVWEHKLIDNILKSKF